MDKLKKCVESNLAKINYLRQDRCNIFDEQMLNFYIRRFNRSQTRADSFEEELSIGSNGTDSDDFDNVS